MNSISIAPPVKPLESFVHQRSQKVQGAFALLLKMAYSLGPNAQLPTFKQLCADLNVSKTTLNTALIDLERDHIVYRKQGAGIFVSPQLRRSIALVCTPHFSADPNNRNFWEVIMREAQLRTAANNYDLAFHFTTGTLDSAPEGSSLHPGLMDDIRARRVQGVLAVGVSDECIEWINQQGIAVVVFAGKGPVSVNLDHLSIVALGAQALAAHGCRRLALWSEAWSGIHEGTRDEARTFRRVLADRGLEYHNDWLRPQALKDSGRSSYELARDWVSQIFDTPRESWPDSLLISDDILTRDVMLALQNLDIVPNRDILIASHANTGSPVLQAYESNLILVQIDAGEIVQSMFKQLETSLRGEVLSEPAIMLKPHLKVGEFVPPNFSRT